jgi:hypothetical protein
MLRIPLYPNPSSPKNASDFPTLIPKAFKCHKKEFKFDELVSKEYAIPMPE